MERYINKVPEIYKIFLYLKPKSLEGASLQIHKLSYVHLQTDSPHLQMTVW